jgi:hypothetical protein
MTTPTRLNAVEIAKVIRARIKAAQKAGKLSKAIKISVRSDSYSQGSSVDVRSHVRALPESSALAFMAAYLRAQVRRRTAPHAARGFPPADAGNGHLRRLYEPGPALPVCLRGFRH